MPSEDAIPTPLSTVPGAPHGSKEARKALIRDIDLHLVKQEYARAIEGMKEVHRQGKPSLAAEPGATAGLVEVFSATVISGYLDSAVDGPEIEVRVNNRPIVRTSACQNLKGRATGFTIRLDNLWRYVGTGDVITVTTTAGKPLLIEDIGPTLRIVCTLWSGMRNLHRKLAKGFGFNKLGQVRKKLHLHHEKLQQTMEAFALTKSVVADHFGHTVFVSYGTLLGTIRGGEFIGHDHDIDLLYVSDKQSPEEVRAEFTAVCRAFTKAGLRITVKPFGVRVKRPGMDFSVGLHYGWFDEKNALNTAFGYRGPQVIVPERKLSFEQRRLGQFQVEVPTVAEAMLEMLYGPTWRIPDPGFTHHDGNRIVNRRYHLSNSEVDVLNAENEAATAGMAKGKHW